LAEIQGEAAASLSHTPLRQQADGRRLTMARVANIGELNWDYDYLSNDLPLMAEWSHKSSLHDFLLAFLAPVSQNERRGSVSSDLHMLLRLDHVVETRTWNAYVRPDGLDVYLPNESVSEESRIQERLCDLRPSLKYAFSKLADYLGTEVSVKVTEDGNALELCAWECDQLGRINNADRLLHAIARKLPKWEKEATTTL